MRETIKYQAVNSVPQTLLPTAPIAELPSPSAATAATSRETVLLIDDSDDIASLVRYAFETHGNNGYQLQCATTLSAGLGLISGGGIDLVLLDLGLPDCTGPLSYVWVRESSPALPVVVVTGDNSEETLLEVVASGAEDFLTKDQLSGPELVQAIRVALYANRERQRSEEAARRLRRRALLDLL